MNYIKIILSLTLIFFVSCKEEEHNMEIVKQLDINRFMGDWYVIGVIPNFIEKDATNGIESYTLNEKGDVDIQYTFQKNGKSKTMNAKGFIQDERNSFWKVQFLWPVKLPYLVLDYAEDNSYTVIGVPNRKFVWIMSRENKMDDDVYTNILTKLEDIGYDISLIKKMEQNW